jgi:dolichol-phosphate mannosyltransferase
MNKTKEEIAIIVPTYNEKENILRLIKEIRKYHDAIHIYVIDDNSPDGTHEVVKSYITKSKDEFTHIFLRNMKSGRGGAVLEGLKHAYENRAIQYMLEMDADLSHDPAEISAILSKKAPKTVVIGSRYVKGSKIIDWPFRRVFQSNLANRYIRMILNVQIHDYTNGFRCYPRKAVEVLLTSDIQHKGFITLSETVYLLYKNGFQFAEVPITFRDRTKGKSNATPGEVFRSLIAVLQIKSRYTV